MKYELISRKQWLEASRWLMYGFVFLFSMLLQSSVLPRMPIANVCLSAVPVCIACIAVQEGAEAGGIFAIVAGVFFALSGVSLGPIYVFTLTLSAVLSGGICEHHFTRGFLSSVIMSLMSLAICLVAAFLYRVYLGTAAFRLWKTILLPEILYSVILSPIFYFGAWIVSKMGREE